MLADVARDKDLMRQIGIALACCLLLGACGGTDDDAGGNTAPEEAEESVSVTGSLTSSDMTEEIVELRGGGCEGRFGNYEGMSAGADVLVEDGDGSLIGKGELEDGIVTDSFADFVGCRWQFTVDDLPQSDFYTFKIGQAEASFSLQELEDDDFEIQLSY